MSKVKVSHTVDVPDAFIFYDLPSSEFVCRGCGKRQKWDLDEPVTRGGGPSDKARIKNFMGTHGACAAARAAIKTTGGHAHQERLTQILVGEKVEIVRSSGDALELTLTSTSPKVSLVVQGEFDLTFYGNPDSVRPTEKITFGS